MMLTKLTLDDGLQKLPQMALIYHLCHQQQRHPAQPEHVPNVGTPLSTPCSGSRLGWRSWLSLWCEERQRTNLRHLNDLWDAQHAQVQAQTVEGPLDSVPRTRPSLGLMLYATLG
jgi:hypothetical protein